MRILGLLGGMAWPSTLETYRTVNEEVARVRGGAHSARIVLWSVDFAEVERLQHAGDWDAAGALLADAARRLEQAGAGALLLCTNTMHRVAPAIEQATAVPLLHIGDAIAAAAHAAGARRVGLLGTRFTMEQPFLRERLTAAGVDVEVPGEQDRELVHRVIYEELIHGILREDSRQAYREVAARLVDRGAEAVVAGCTEIELLLAPTDVTVPLLASSRLHALAGARWLLDDPSLLPDPASVVTPAEPGVDLPVTDLPGAPR